MSDSMETGSGGAGSGETGSGNGSGRSDSGGPGAGMERSSTGLDANVAALLAYLLGFVTGVVFWVIEKDSEFVRFHAVQSTLLFGGLLVLNLFGNLIPVVGVIITIVIGPVAFLVWLFLMLKAFQGERFKLPVIGDMAEERSALP